MITNPIKLENVGKVYSGKAGRCACGCSGTYWVASKHREWADKNRGYPYDDSDISDKQVRRVVNLINQNIDAAESFGKDGIMADIGNRTYAVYFVE